MTDETNHSSKDAEIEAMLLASAVSRNELAAPGDSAGMPRQHASMRAIVAPGHAPRVEYLDAEQAAIGEGLASVPPTLMHDDGRDLDAELKKIAQDLHDTVMKKNEVRYDPRTGAKIFRRSEQERAILSLQARNLSETLSYQQVVYEQLAEQRRILAEEKRLEMLADVQRDNYLSEQAIIEADRIEIRRRAEAIVLRRDNKARSGSI